MFPAVPILAAVAAGSIPAASALASARWPGRAPAAAILLWQALGLGWGLAAVGALAGLGADPGQAGALPGGVAGAALAVASRVIRGGAFRPPAPGPLADLRLVSVAAGLVLLMLLCWVLVAASAAVLRARRRQRELLSLLAHGDPKVPGALVLDHPAAAAYCVPGLRSRIVISAGTLELLDQAELAAVLAHERAHLRERHDLVLLPFTALLRVFRWSAVARRAEGAVALLVEMLADDHALRHRALPGSWRRRCCGWARRARGCRPARSPPRPALPAATARWPFALPGCSGRCPGCRLPTIALVCGAAVLLVAVPVAVLFIPF